MPTTPAHRRPPLLTAAVVAVALLWAAGLVCLPVAVGLHLSNAGLTAFSLTAGAVAIVRGRRHTGRVRRFWVRLGAASSAWGSGMAAWTWYESLRAVEVPFPSVADLGYLACPLLAGWALLTLPLAAPTRAGRARTLLDGLLVASSLLLVSWMLVLDTIVQAGGDLASQLISLAYPVSDVVLITTVVYTLMGARSRGAGRPMALPLIGVGLVALAVADSGFVYLTTADAYSSGNWIDLGWGAGFCLLLLAALQPDESAEEVVDGEVVARPFGNLLPYAAVGVALLTSSAEVLRGGSTDAATYWIRTAIIVLLVARQVLTLRENEALTRNLERRVEARTAELRASAERFAALVQHSSDLVTVVDRSGTLVYQSRSSQRVLGVDAAALVGRPLNDLVHPLHASELSAALNGVASDAGRVQTVRSTWRHASGRDCQVEITLTNLLANPAVGGIVLNTRDITDRTRLEGQLTHQAFTDSLTGLPNRALFRDRLQHALSRRAGASQVAVYFLDLDGFKGVNDTLGHNAGDELLVEVAARLRSAVRPSETVARLGGDEFAVLVEDLADGEDGTALAQRICDAVAAPVRLAAGERAAAGQRRHRPSRRPLRRRRAGAAQRRPGDVPGQGRRRGRLRRLRPGDARAPGRPDASGGGPASGAVRGPAPPALPADGLHADRCHHRRGSARALAAPRAWARPARRLHPAGRGHRPHPAARPVGAARGVPAGGRLGGERRAAWTAAQRQRVGAPAPAGRHRRPGRRGPARAPACRPSS